MDTQDKTLIRQLPQVYYERDHQIIPACFWPAQLIDLAMARSLVEHKILRHTSLFCEDINHPDHYIYPEQLLRLIRNIENNSTADDISFLFGHQLLPGNITGISEQLTTANNLHELIEILLKYQSLFCPLLNILRHYEGDQLVLCWQDACGAEDSLTFLLEAMTTAICSFVRWRSNIRQPWKIYFAHKMPAYIEQHQVHLDADIHFGCQRNAMTIARDYCFRPWSKSTTKIFQSQCTPTLIAPHKIIIPRSRGFLAEVYDYLNNNITSDPNLEKTAADFGMSNTSFKRKLKKHRSHFQALYDQVRKDLAVYWINQEGWSNEQVAQKLHFHDVANLRRAFKKWTGLTLIAARRST